MMFREARSATLTTSEREAKRVEKICRRRPSGPGITTARRRSKAASASATMRSGVDFSLSGGSDSIFRQNSVAIAPSFDFRQVPHHTSRREREAAREVASSLHGVGGRYHGLAAWLLRSSVARSGLSVGTCRCGPSRRSVVGVRYGTRSAFARQLARVRFRARYSSIVLVRPKNKFVR